MKITAQRMLAAALLVLPLAFGCQTMEPESITVEMPTVETPQDAALSKAVRDHLLTDKKVDLSGVTIVSGGGTVFLSGTVKSLDARQQAIKMAWEVRGVKGVVNRLEVEK
jgi:osmotically-inducible protein OsmY